MKVIGGTRVEIDEKKLFDYMKCRGKKATLDEFIKEFKIKGEASLNEFMDLILGMEYSGKLYLDNKGFYHIFDEQILLEQGVIHISKDGYGYVNVEKDGKVINYMIYNRDLNGALPKDLVIIRPRKKSFLGHNLAIVEKILQRDKFLEIFEYQGNGVFVPYEILSNFKVKSSYVKDLVEHSLVLMEVQTKGEYEGNDLFFCGSVKKIIGHRDDPKIDEKAICLKYGFDYHFSPKIMNVVNKIPNMVLDEDYEGRVDLRGKKIFTIDGKDTKDMDDAISIEKEGNGFVLSVHIADVSHYLLKNPELIEEVIKRGNSAYVADSVVPMLPHKLSNGICSLNPNEDRLAKTVEMHFDKYGKLRDYTIYKSVIRSLKKMNYDDVNALLEEGNVLEGYESFVCDLLEMNKLSNLLTEIRRKKGCLVLDDVEVKINTDIEGTPVSIKRHSQRSAECLIENFMIMANIAVTESYGYLDQPFIYRIHEAPDLFKLQTTLEILQTSGVVDISKMNDLLMKIQRARDYNLDIKPIDLQSILLDAKNNDNLMAITNLILRSMKKAIYSNENIGHFGLAEDDYSHFTSPIRRAADAVNHIIIDLHMRMQMATNDEEIMVIQAELNKYDVMLNQICEHISEMEVAAFNAEKEIEELKMIRYVTDNIEDYIGPIEAQICNTSKLGIVILVDEKIKAMVSSADLSSLGFGYMRDSRSYVGKGKDKFKLGTHLYVLDPEVSLQHRIICYHIPLTEEDYQKQFCNDDRKLIKSIHCNF